MPTPPLSDALAQEALDAYERCDHSKRRAAQMLGIADSTFTNRFNAARSRGLHMSEGARDSATKAGLGGLEVRGGHRRVYDEDGKQIDTVRYSVPQADLAQDTMDRLREALEGLTPAEPVAAPSYADADLLTVYPIADRHQGMLAWGKETGEDYDQKIAVNRMRDWIGRCVASSPASETAVILDIGDGEHIDDATNQTPKSKHTLDADGRIFLTLENSIESLDFCIQSALGKHKQVLVRILPGNHNPTLYLAVLFALAERYRNEPRVEVQKVPGEFFAFEWGANMLTAHHGDKAKPERLVHFIADEFAPMWGRTRHRFLWTGHLHHHKSADIGGCRHEQLRAVTARDAYAYSHAYSARAQLQAVTLHKAQGEIQRVMVNA